MSEPQSRHNPHELALRDFALGYPEAHEDFPWGERALKVKGKVFLFMGGAQGGLGLSLKLPHSREAALMLPFATPTGYGLGKSGWVSAQFPKGEKPPLELLRQWIDESYRAVAPKKLVALLGGAEKAKAAAPKRATALKRAAAKKPARKKQRATVRRAR